MIEVMKYSVKVIEVIQGQRAKYLNYQKDIWNKTFSVIWFSLCTKGGNSPVIVDLDFCDDLYGHDNSHLHI